MGNEETKYKQVPIQKISYKVGIFIQKTLLNKKNNVPIMPNLIQLRRDKACTTYLTIKLTSRF